MRIRYLAVVWPLLLLCTNLLSYTLTITKGGTGDGYIKVNGANQSLPYSGSFGFMSSVVLEAVPYSSSYFVSWTGTNFNRTENPVTFPMPMANLSLTANFDLNRFTFTINKGGNGDGQVKLWGIYYTLPFSADYPSGTLLDFEAVPSKDCYFVNWTGNNLSTADNPHVFEVPAYNVIYYVNFEPCPRPKFNTCFLRPITIVDNDGDGFIRFSNLHFSISFSDIYCPTYQLYFFIEWDDYPLPQSGWPPFSGGEGSFRYPESGFLQITRANCVFEFNLNDDFLNDIAGKDSSGWGIRIWYNINGHFEVIGGPRYFESNAHDTPAILIHTLSLSKSGTGTGRVKVNNILRTLPYSESAAEGTAFSLEAVPASGSIFSGWSGDNNSSASKINLTLDADKNLTAAFNLSQTQTKTLNITQSGLGTGQVKVNNVLRKLPYTEEAASGTAFTLEAVPTSFSLFPGWTGAVTSTNPAINLTLNADKTLNAVFNLAPPYPNMLKNGEFSDGTNNWYFSVQSPAAAAGTVQNGEYSLACQNGGDASWHIQLIQWGLLIENGCTYHVLYDAYASASKVIIPAVGKNSDPWTVYGYHAETITTLKTRYDYSFTMNNPTDPDGRLAIDLGLSKSSLHLDNVVIIKKTNAINSGGWQDQSAGVTINLTDVDVVSNLMAWAAGGSALVLRTIDGGKNWQNVTGSLPKVEILSIEGFAENSALVSLMNGSVAQIGRTINGGQNWQLVYQQGGGQINDITMFDAARGIAVGNPVAGKWTILETKDGGSTWQPKTTSFAATTGVISYPLNAFWHNETNGWFGTNNTTAYNTINGGSNWSAVTIAPLTSINLICFNSKGVGLATGNAVLAESAADGTNWQRISSPAGFNRIYTLNSAGVLFWLGSGKNIYRSEDDGASWIPEGELLSWIAAIDIKREGSHFYGYSVGADGAIMRYDNTIVTEVTADEGGEKLPEGLQLHQNYPNPFNAETRIPFELPFACQVRLGVYDMLGHEVKPLVNESMAPGLHEASLQAGELPSGVYFYRLIITGAEGQNYQATKKLMLIK